MKLTSRRSDSATPCVCNFKAPVKPQFTRKRNTSISSFVTSRRFSIQFTRSRETNSSRPITDWRDSFRVEFYSKQTKVASRRLACRVLFGFQGLFSQYSRRSPSFLVLYYLVNVLIVSNQPFIP